jgi:hypothetical protein
LGLALEKRSKGKMMPEGATFWGQVAWFLATVIALLADPIAFIGYAVVGALPKKIWQAALLGTVWGIAASILIKVVGVPSALNYVPSRMVGGAAASALVWALLWPLRRPKGG